MLFVNAGIIGVSKSRRNTVIMFAVLDFLAATPAVGGNIEICDKNGVTASLKASPSAKDMHLSSDGFPHGAYSVGGGAFKWAKGPRIGRGSNPQRGWNFAISTGMIYENEIGSDPAGTLIEIRDLKLIIKPERTNRWCQLDSVANPNGRFFLENFKDDVSKNADIKKTKHNTSFTPQPGWVFHFWGNRVSLIPYLPLKDVYAEYQARLVSNEGSLKNKNYLAASSADYWMSKDAQAGHVDVLNEDVAIGRFIALSAKWKTISMSTQK